MKRFCLKEKSILPNWMYKMTNDSKTAVVTGAGTGIGKAVALTFLRNGFNVVLAGRREGPLQEVIESSGVSSEKALAVSVDVGNAPEVENRTTAAHVISSVQTTLRIAVAARVDSSLASIASD